MLRLLDHPLRSFCRTNACCAALLRIRQACAQAAGQGLNQMRAMWQTPQHDLPQEMWSMLVDATSH